MEMVWVAKSNNGEMPNILKGIECVENNKVFKQSLLRRLIKIQSIMPCRFLRQFLINFRKWESQKTARLVAAYDKEYEGYIPIFASLRGLPIRVSNVYVEMEKDIAPYLSDKDRERYVKSILLLSLGKEDQVSSLLNFHELERLFGSKYFTVDWTQYDSFIVKKRSKKGRIICIFTTKVFTEQVALASVGVHDDAYKVDRFKLKFDEFGKVDSERVERERRRLEKKEQENLKKKKERHKRGNINRPLANISELWQQRMKKD